MTNDKQSVTASAAVGQICGFGSQSYLLAINAAYHLIQEVDQV